MSAGADADIAEAEKLEPNIANRFAGAGHAR